MSTIVQDLKDWFGQLQSARSRWEHAWKDCVRFGMPMASEAFDNPGALSTAMLGLLQGPSSEERGRELFDSTFVIGLDRLSAGMVSLVTPSGSDYWHGIGSDDVFGGEEDQESSEWYERVRNYLFKVRYDPRSGFITTNEKSIKHACGIGTGLFFIREGFGKDGYGPSTLPFLYEFVPTTEAWIVPDASGRPCGLFRCFTKSARNVAKEFGEKVSEHTKAAANDPARREEDVTILHAVFKRDDISRAKLGNLGAAYASFYVEMDNDHLIGESGYYEFPYAVDYWAQDDNSAYGQSPIMYMLAEAKSLQVLTKHVLRATQQLTDPALATTDHEVRPNLNPRAVNPGMIDENGRLKVQPIVTAQNLNFADARLEAMRNQARDGMYLNLWNILATDRERTAQEILVRANEKAELVGPAGGRLQVGRAHMVEREINILERKGAFRPGMPLEAPQNVQGKGIGIRFTSPLDRLRRANEQMAIERTVQTTLAVAQFDPDVADEVDGSEVVRLTREISGAPAKIMRKPEEVQARRQQRQAALQAQQAAALAEQAGKAGQAIGATAEKAPQIQQMAEMMGLA